MIIDAPASFPDMKWELGRYLGPSIDVGTAMTYKILKSTGKYVNCSTLWPLTLKEHESPEHQELHKKFDIKVHDALGQVSAPEDFDEDHLTPSYEPY